MKNVLLSGCTTLLQCEETLNKLVEPGELLGKVPLSVIDWHTITKTLKKLVENFGESDGTSKIWAYYPTCAALYLVYAGIELYEKGEFWPKVYENISISPKTYPIWAQRFIAFLEKNKLPTFSDIGGYRYITPILGHGGIPTYCLPDFFKYVLSRAVHSTEMIGDDILNDLADTTRFYVDKPVQRFLTKGGDYAFDFVNRCMEMAQEYRSHKLVAPEFVGLPARIVNHYIEWVQKEVAAGMEEDGHFLRSPSLQYQPYELGIVINLPAQRLKGWVQTAEWKIISDKGFLKRVRHPIRYINGNSEIKEQELPLLPSEEYRTTFLADNTEIRTWVFTIPRNKPFLAFQPDNGRRIRTEGISGEETWLVLKHGWTIQTGEVKVIEELPPLGTLWRDYRGLLVQFRRSPQLILRGPEGETLTVPILNKLVKPRLVGGKVFAHSEISDCQIYSNELPYIRFPHPVDDQPTRNWWDKWSVSVEYNGEAELTHMFQVSDFLEQLSIDEFYSLLPLDSINLLHKKVGQIKLKIKGPIGYDAILQFIAFPPIDFRLLGNNPWPVGITGSPNIKFLWTMPNQYSLSLSAASSRTLNDFKNDRGLINTTGELLARALNITGELHCSPSESYGFAKLIRPVRWGWIGLDQRGTVQWETSVRKINLLDWENYPDTTLIIQFTNEITSAYRGEITLRDVTRKELYTVPFDLSSTKYHKFTLSRWHDAVAISQSPTLYFLVRIFEGSTLLTEFCPAEIVKKWEVTNLQVLPEDLRGRSFSVCNVFWEESFRIIGKMLRVWSVWRPWEEPRTFEIDEDDSAIRIELSSDDLNPGIYRFEIAQLPVVDDFSEDPVVGSFPVGAKVYDLKVKTSEWHQYLLSLPEDVSGDLEKYLARTYPNKNYNKYNQPIQCDQINIENARQIVATSQTIANQCSCERFVDFIYFIKPYLTETNKLLILQAMVQWLEEGRQLHKVVPVGLGLDTMIKNSDLFEQLNDCEVDTIWAYWPAIGFLAELNSNRYQSLYDHMEKYISKAGLELLFGRPALGPFKRKSGEVCRVNLPDCLKKIFSFDCICNSFLPDVPKPVIGDFDSANLIAQKDLEELHLLYENIGLYPEGLFHRDFIANEMYNWLIDIKQDKSEEHFDKLTIKYLDAADSELNKWQQEEIINIDVINTLKKRRCSFKGTLPLVNFPYLVGFCVLRRRLQARNLVEERPLWETLLYEVVRSCPDLYGHDLCLFEILLNVWL